MDKGNTVIVWNDAVPWQVRYESDAQLVRASR